MRLPTGFPLISRHLRLHKVEVVANVVVVEVIVVRQLRRAGWVGGGGKSVILDPARARRHGLVEEDRAISNTRVHAQ